MALKIRLLIARLLAVAAVRNIKKIIAAALAAFFSPFVCATEITLLSGFASWHQHQCKTVAVFSPPVGGGSVVGAPINSNTAQSCLNQNNYGIGVRFDSGEWKNYAVGIYQNSYNRPSVYVAKEFTTRLAGPFHAGVLVGAVTGYRYPITPWVVPELIAKFDRCEIALLAQPFGADRAAALQIRMRF